MSKKYPRHYNDQVHMYDSLSKRAPDLTESELPQYFKEASMGTPAKVEKTYSPIKNLTITRDNFGVPHIRGKTRKATFFGVGYATAEDRLFLMDVLRHLGRGRLSEFLGESESNKEMDRNQLKNAPYKESDLTDQIRRICEQGSEGEEICRDIKAYMEGVNAYIDKARWNWTLLPVEYLGLMKLPQKWKPEDAVAIASFVGGLFGKGGGRELESAQFLAELQNEFGKKEGRKIWADFRSANDREAPVTTVRPFPYNNPGNIDQASVAMPDLSTVNQTLNQLKNSDMIADGPFGPINLRLPKSMSNAILVVGNHTRKGNPIAVFGPQTGYFNPQLLLEMDVQGPGIEARGVGFAGSNLYIQMGRGKEFAWSATSSAADNTDQWILRLCEPDGKTPSNQSTHYLYKGKCIPMEQFTHQQSIKSQAVPVKDLNKTAVSLNQPPKEVIEQQQNSSQRKKETMDTKVERSVYGPVIARGTVKNRPVAIAVQRSTYGNELGSSFGFKRLNDPDFMKGGAQSFSKAIDSIDYTFNWFFVDQTDIAYKHSGLLPIRHPGTDPDLPVWGTGEYDWTGDYLPPEKQPQEINPKQGYFVNWNNKQAPGFRANDANFNYGPVFRSLTLEKRLKKAIESDEKLTTADMVNITTAAGTVDLKGQEVYPYVLKILGKQAPGNDQKLQAMRDRLAEWVKTGGYRRDIAPRDGQYDNATAIAIGDAFFAPLVKGIFGAPLKGIRPPVKLEDRPDQHLGSAYQEGYYPFVQKDLRQVLGEKVTDPWYKTYCGNGDRAACRDILWNALSEAAAHLEKEYSSASVDDWIYGSQRDAIRQSTLGALSLPDMGWVNRPTFQQVVQVQSTK
ncbi:penicillin acylase family protein [Salinithrix halophila]|uniref:Penicillin acylase family protein n=2 Tax=Salinithrix halophila TaxID=1485204 RepID=A0ABV8JE28_9BACL